MFARIGTWQGPHEGLENWVARAGEVVKSNVQRQPGLPAAYWLVDREGGKGLTLTFWESEEAMRASEEFRSQSQSQTSAATGAGVTTEKVRGIRPYLGVSPFRVLLGKDLPETSARAACLIHRVG